MREGRSEMPRRRLRGALHKRKQDDDSVVGSPSAGRADALVPADPSQQLPEVASPVLSVALVGGAARDTKEARPWQHVLVWLVGVVLASLMPILWATQSTSPEAVTPSIYTLLGSGDLYLISVVVIIAGLTEIVLVLRRINQVLTVALLVLAAILVVLIDAARYAGASSVTTNSGIPPHSITYWSLVAFGFSALHSSICVNLAAGIK
jgi:hypothetical protein